MSAGFFIDRILDRCAKFGSPVCVGIDPVFEQLPDELKRRGSSTSERVDAIFDFSLSVLRLAAEHAAAVKIQSAYFECYRTAGVEAYFSLVAEARELGMPVIGDVKRGDIGPTSAAYAAAHLTDELPGSTHGESDDLEPDTAPDAITVNPMLGLDGVQPFVDAALPTGKGIFFLVRTSNPGSAALQDVRLADGRTWSELLADTLRPLIESPGHIGRCGLSNLGAVVGATQVSTMASLRSRLPKSLFLLPGYGAQGATADMTRAAFINGKGALVSASRSILYAYANKSGPWQSHIEKAMADMSQDLKRVIENA